MGCWKRKCAKVTQLLQDQSLKFLLIKQKSVEWLRDLGNLEVNVTDVRTIKCLVLLPDSFFFFFFFDNRTSASSARSNIASWTAFMYICAGSASGSGYAGDEGWIWMKGQLTSVACRWWKDSTRLRVASKHSKQPQNRCCTSAQETGKAFQDNLYVYVEAADGKNSILKL